MYLDPIFFLLLFYGSAHSIGSQSSISKNLNKISHNDSLNNYNSENIGQIQINNENFSNLSPKVSRKSFGMVYNIWQNIFHFGKKNEKVKSRENVDWVEFLRKISVLNELVGKEQYSESLKEVERFTRDIDELTISGSGMIVSDPKIKTLTKGISLILNPGGKNVMINGKIFNDYYPIKWLRSINDDYNNPVGENVTKNMKTVSGYFTIERLKSTTDKNIKINNTKIIEDSMLIRFFKKLGEINALFQRGEFRKAQRELKLITKGIDRLTVDDELVISGDIIGRLTRGIRLVYGPEAVVINGRFLRYKANGIKFKAGGPVFFRGEKISETSKQIRSLQRINGNVYINNILIEKGKFYNF